MSISDYDIGIKEADPNPDEPGQGDYCEGCGKCGDLEIKFLCASCLEEAQNNSDAIYECPEITGIECPDQWSE